MYQFIENEGNEQITNYLSCMFFSAFKGEVCRFSELVIIILDVFNSENKMELHKEEDDLSKKKALVLIYQGMSLSEINLLPES